MTKRYQGIVFSVLLWYTDSDYTLGIFWPSFLLWYTDSDYTLGIFWTLCCLFFYDIQILITPWYPLAIVLSPKGYSESVNHRRAENTMAKRYQGVIRIRKSLKNRQHIQIVIAPLVSFGHCVVCSSMIYRFWLTPWYLLAIVLSDLLWYTDNTMAKRSQGILRIRKS
jgi:hypothetical protein